VIVDCASRVPLRGHVSKADPLLLRLLWRTTSLVLADVSETEELVALGTRHHEIATTTLVALAFEPVKGRVAGARGTRVKTLASR
jgi:hypothetical protein